MNLSSLFPPTILARLLDDLGAVAEAARRLPELEQEVLQRVDRMQNELVAVRAEITAVRKGMDGLREDVAPIQELSAVREGVETLGGKLDELRGDVQPIQEIKAVREGVETLGGKLDELRGDVQPIEEIKAVREGLDALNERIEPIGEITALREGVDELNERILPIQEITEVRKGIEPLDEDMRAVRTSVTQLEPLMREVIARLDALRADLGPLGDLADKIPGIGR